MKTIVAGAILSFLLVNYSSGREAFEQIVLPLQVVEATPGAYDSLWQTRTTVHNGSDQPIFICFPPTGSCSVIEGRETWTEKVSTAYQVRSENVAYLHFLVILRNENDVFDVGTSLPVIRPEDWRDTIILPGLLIDNHSRSHLRLVAKSTEEDQVVAVRLFDESSGELIHERSVAMRGGGNPILEAPMMDLGAQLEAIGLLPSRVRVEINSDGPPIFGFVSITDNLSQQVLIIEPR